MEFNNVIAETSGVADQAIDSILAFTKNHYVSLFIVNRENEDPLSRTCVSYDGEFIYELNNSGSATALWDDLDAFKEVLKESLKQGEHDLLIFLSNYETNTSEGVVSISPNQLDYVVYYKYNISLNTFIASVDPDDNFHNAPDWDSEAGFLFDYEDEEDNVSRASGIDSMINYLSSDSETDIEDMMVGIQELVNEKLLPFMLENKGSHKISIYSGLDNELLDSADFISSGNSKNVLLSAQSSFLKSIQADIRGNNPRDTNLFIRFLGVYLLSYGNLNLYLVSNSQTDTVDFQCLTWTIFKNGYSISGTADDAKEFVLSKYGSSVLPRFEFIDAE